MLKIMYLMQRGLSLTQAVDYHVVEDEGIPAEDWATVRGVTARAVSKNVEDSRDALDDGPDGETPTMEEYADG